MKYGQLKHRASIYEVNADLKSVELGGVWLEIQAKESADPAFPVGLRSPARIDIRAWYSERLVQGRYLKHEERLFQITSARDVMGTKAELRITADEFIGQPAQYRPQEGVPVPCRVHLTHEAPYRDEMGQVAEYKVRAEVLVIEVGRPQADDQLMVAGTLYTVIAYADETDDGVVRGLWLEKV